MEDEREPAPTEENPPAKRVYALNVDWEAVERDYRAGIMTLRAIATLHGTKHNSILKRAKRLQWDRDLAPRIRARAVSKVARGALIDTTGLEPEQAAKKMDQATEQEVVEANATMQAEVIRSHRKVIGRFNTLAGSLLAELEGQATSGEDGTSPSPVLTLPARVDCLKKLADTIRVLVALERESFALDAPKPRDNESDEFANMSTAELRKFVLERSVTIFGVQVKEVTGG